MAKKPSLWGNSEQERIVSQAGWFIGTRKFVCTDNATFCWQMKTARTRWSFDNPTASSYGWVSKISSRHRKDFASREEAFAAALTNIAATEKHFADHAAKKTLDKLQQANKLADTVDIEDINQPPI